MNLFLTACNLSNISSSNVWGFSKISLMVCNLSNIVSNTCNLPNVSLQILLMILYNLSLFFWKISLKFYNMSNMFWRFVTFQTFLRIFLSRFKTFRIYFEISWIICNLSNIFKVLSSFKHFFVNVSKDTFKPLGNCKDIPQCLQPFKHVL